MLKGYVLKIQWAAWAQHQQPPKMLSPQWPNRPKSASIWRFNSLSAQAIVNRYSKVQACGSEMRTSITLPRKARF